MPLALTIIIGMLGESMTPNEAFAALFPKTAARVGGECSLFDFPWSSQAHGVDCVVMMLFDERFDDIIERANARAWYALCKKELGAEGAFFDDGRAGLWVSTGRLFEQWELSVRVMNPDGTPTKAAEVVESALCRLERYPILDDDTFLEVERGDSEEIHKEWVRDGSWRALFDVHTNGNVVSVSVASPKDVYNRNTHRESYVYFLTPNGLPLERTPEWCKVIEECLSVYHRSEDFPDFDTLTIARGFEKLRGCGLFDEYDDGTFWVPATPRSLTDTAEHPITSHTSSPYSVVCLPCETGHNSNEL